MNENATPNPPSETTAVVLLSGGVDSATTLAIARNQGHRCYCLSFDYGQRHRVELEAAKRVAETLGAAEHKVVTLDPQSFTGSALTGDGAIPKNRSDSAMTTGIPTTYVPARNTIFLSYALGWAEVLDAEAIYIGVTAVDYSGYPDCRPEYIAAFERMAQLATKAGAEGRPIAIRVPLIDLGKASIISKGDRLGVDYGMTHSCYDPTPAGKACGACDSCIMRKRGFEEAELPDPTAYG